MTAGTRLVVPEALNVAPALLGATLASPGRRLAAMAIDLLLVGGLSSLANGWLLAGLALLVVDGLRRSAGRTPWPGWRWAALPLLLAGLWAGPSEHRVLRINTGDDETAEVATGAASAAVGAASAPAREVVLAARVAALESEVATLQAAQDHPPAWHRQLLHRLAEVGIGWGGALAYFTLLPAWWRGQTPGKRLLGLRVVELTGRPMTALLALRRYGGYAAGLATGGLGLLQLLWDPNRQGLQDKAAHTVVLDVRGG